MKAPFSFPIVIDLLKKVVVRQNEEANVPVLPCLRRWCEALLQTLEEISLLEKASALIYLRVFFCF